MTSGSRLNQLSDRSDHAELRDYYDRQGDEAARSGRGIRCSEETVTRAVIELLHSNLNSFQTILDVGCGANLDYDLFLAEQGKDVIGLELSRSFLKLAPRHPRIQLIQGDATALPFADERFEAAVCSETVEHIPSDQAVVAEVAHVLRPNGLLVFSVPNLWNLERLIEMARRRTLTVSMMEGHLREIYEDARRTAPYPALSTSSELSLFRSDGPVGGGPNWTPGLVRNGLLLARLLEVDRPRCAPALMGIAPPGQESSADSWHLLTGEYPPQPGGVADYTQQLARALSESGKQVHVWAPGRHRSDRINGVGDRPRGPRLRPGVVLEPSCLLASTAIPGTTALADPVRSERLWVPRDKPTLRSLASELGN